MHRVLIVDDEYVVAETLRLIFEKHGFHTRKAHSAMEAMACAAEFAPDLLLCDLNMPIKDGTVLIAEMADAHPTCRVLVLTGSAAGGNRVGELGMALRRPMEVLSKPCPPSELLRVAGAILAV